MREKDGRKQAEKRVAECTRLVAGSAVRGAANLLWDVIVLERVVVGENHGGAVLLTAILAVTARAAAVDHAADAYGCAHRQVFHVGADKHHAPHDLVTRDHGELCRAPVFTHLMHVRVADAREEDVDSDVVGARRAAGDGVRDKGPFAREGGVSFGFAHV